jgi:hypothetical protein
MILSLKKVVAMTVIVSLLGVAGAFGLRTLSFREIIGPIEAETICGPIKLTVRLDKNTFSLGEEVNVTVTITNISNETILLSYAHLPKIDFAVYDSSSKGIYTFSGTHGFLAVEAGIVLEASESWGAHTKWNQQRVIGRYGLHYLGPADEHENGLEKIMVETPTIEIQIF